MPNVHELVTEANRRAATLEGMALDDASVVALLDWFGSTPITVDGQAADSEYSSLVSYPEPSGWRCERTWDWEADNLRLQASLRLDLTRHVPLHTWPATPTAGVRVTAIEAEVVDE